MPRKGRPPNTIPSTIKGINLPNDLIAKIDLMLLDPLTGKPSYGAWAELVTGLLRKWLDEQITLAKSRGPQG